MIHSENVEASVLSIMLHKKEYLNKGCNDLTVEHFENEKHSKLFELLLSMQKESKSVDLTTVATECSKLGVMTTTELISVHNASFTDVYYKNYVLILNEYKIRRKLGILAVNLTNRIGNKIDTYNILGWTETEIRKIKGVLKSETTFNISDDIRSYVESVLKNEVEAPAFVTGYEEIDDKIYGFNRGDYVVIGARTSMGKTAFMLNVLANNQNRGCKALVVSIEMSKKQLLSRLLAMESATDLYKITRGYVKTDEDRKSVVEALNVIQKYNIVVDDSGHQTAMKIRSKAEEIKEKGLDVIVIDHIGLVDFGKSKSIYEGITELSRELKVIAKELDVVIIVICQLNRELMTRSDKTPTLSDIRSSGAIEQDADVILLLHSDDYYDNDRKSNNEYELQVIVGKDRNNGGLGTYKLKFIRNLQKIKSIKVMGFEVNESVF